jgi:PAS domain S-box-containing protein
MDVDVTEVHRMQETVRSNDSVSDIIFYLSVEEDCRGFRFLSVNDAFLRATGLAESQVLGRRVEEVIPEPSCSFVLTRYQEAIRTGQTVSWDETSVYPSGVRHGEVTVSAIFDETGRCTNLVGTVHDITVRKQAEEERRHLEMQLHQSQRMQSLGTLAGGIAHDFNNVLTAISGHAELALMDAPEGHALHESLSEICRAGRRASALVHQILTFSRPQEPQREVLDVPQAIEEALKLLRATLPASIHVRTRFGGDTPKVYADATQMHQVLMNLCTNAAQAIGDRAGVIEVTSSGFVVDPDARDVSLDLAEGVYACVRVRDDGCGMDGTTLGRMFEPFFTTKPPGRGTGLGLSVVHGIMTSHGGTVGVQSEPGKGTTFSLYIPATHDMCPERGPSRAVIARGRGQHVLYVDDDEALVHVGTRILRRLGYRVTGHADSTEALRDFLLRPGEFAAVVTDLAMPGLSGPDLVRELRAVRPDVPIVMTSGYLRPEDTDLAHRLGIRDLVLKPVTVTQLEEILHRVLATGQPS